jgi:hypothetical protein
LQFGYVVDVIVVVQLWGVGAGEERKQEAHRRSRTNADYEAE